MAKQKKRRKMDPNRISNQPWELDYVGQKFGIGREMVRDAKKFLKTDSRQKIYKYIEENID